MRVRRVALMLLANRERDAVFQFFNATGECSAEGSFITLQHTDHASVWQAVHEGNVSEDGALWRGRHYVTVGFN